MVVVSSGDGVELGAALVAGAADRFALCPSLLPVLDMPGSSLFGAMPLRCERAYGCEVCEALGGVKVSVPDVVRVVLSAG